MLQDGNTALMKAARNGHREASHQLLEVKPYVNEKNRVSE